MIKRFVTLMVFVCAISLAQAPKQSAEDIVQRLVNQVVAWSAEPNQLNSPGTKAGLREIERHEQDGNPTVKYAIYVAGAPQNQTYALVQVTLASPEPHALLPAVFIARDGLVCLDAVPDCTQPVAFSTVSAKGEPFQGVLISKDAKYKITVFVVPNPITGSDHGCNLEVIRLTRKFEAALVRGKGFKPNENVKITGDSAGEAVNGTTVVDANGSFNTALMPFVKDKQSGVETINFKGAACAPAVSFKWGE
ncbi:MAG: hypothetical protein WCG81_04135 [Candidatus Angelobacter sp.]